MSQSVFSSLRYDIRRQNRGAAVIISNTNFAPGTGIQKPGRNNQRGVLKRGEKSADAKIMHDLLQALGFKNIDSYNDLTAAEMRGILQAEKHGTCQMEVQNAITHLKSDKFLDPDNITTEMNTS